MAQAPLREFPGHFLRGMAMGGADVVPGVSGGTVALVLGIYQRLVAAIRHGSAALGRMLTLDFRRCIAQLRDVDWMLLLPLALGVLTAVLLLASALEQQLEQNPVQMAGLVLGLVGGSTVVATRLLTQRTKREWLLMLSAGAIFFLLLGFASGASKEDVASGRPLWIFFAAGAIAICAMILPGISGAFLLVVMGMYGAVLAAVNDRDLVTVTVFLVGCVVGLALFSRLLHWALNLHYNTVMAIMIGLMLGSLRVLWPWPGGVDSVELGVPDQAVGVTVGLVLLGFTIVIVVDAVARRLQHRKVSDEVKELQAS